MDGPESEASSFLLVHNLRLGLPGQLEGRLSLPYAWMEARDEAGEASRNGVGDLLAELRWSRPVDGWILGLSAGSYLPVGELGGRGLPATATFSTGTVDPTLGVQLAGPAVAGLGWSLGTLTRLVLAEQDDGRQLGSSLTSTLAVDRVLGREFVAQLQFVHFHREEDEGPAMEASGGNWLYLAPVLGYRLLAGRGHSLQLKLGARIPVYQDVVGRQLVESPAWNFGLGYTMEL